MSEPLNLETMLLEPTSSTPLRFLAANLLMALRDGTSELFIGPDPDPGVIGVKVQVRYQATLYDLLPPPYAVLGPLLKLVGFLSDIPYPSQPFGIGRLGVEVSGRTADIAVITRSAAESVTFHMPVPHNLGEQAGVVLDQAARPDGTIEFDHDWDNDPYHCS